MEGNVGQSQMVGTVKETALAKEEMGGEEALST